MGDDLFDSGGRAVRVGLELRTANAPRQLPPCPWSFPDVRSAPGYGCVGEGADFAPSTIVAAYRKGIFPWPHPENELLWFSPDPRTVIPLDGLRISRRLGRTVRSGRFRASVDAAFEDVMRACAAERPEGTWITEALIRGYVELHRLGWAHSVEVWDTEGALCGGLYGVGLGAMFGAESMFHRASDASKVAVIALVQHLRDIGVELLDIQVSTPHTESLGAVEISRADYLRRLERSLAREADWIK